MKKQQETGVRCMRGAPRVRHLIPSVPWRSGCARAGCVKNAAVVWMGVALGDSLTGKEAMGYGLSLLGFLGYTFLRSSALGQAAHAKRA